MTAIKKWIKGLFHAPKCEKVSDQSLSRIMLSSVLGILICGICLAGLTWAWFSSSVTSTANHITAANFSVSVEFRQGGSVIAPVMENGCYKLDIGENSGDYTVTVTAEGSATTGYCTVELIFSDQTTNTYHTIQLDPAGGDGRPKSVEFTVHVSNVSYLKMTPQWGTYANPDNEVLIGNSTSEVREIP